MHGPDLAHLTERFAAIRERVAVAAQSVGREPNEIRILVATKTQEADTVRAAIAAGVTLIGENRAQELTAKAPYIADLVTAGQVEVHMIGPVQRNKVNHVLATVTTVQSIDSLAIAEAFSTRCERAGRVLDVLVQVNVSAEPTKSGCLPEDAPELARAIGTLPGLRLTGFMTIGAHSGDTAWVRSGFRRLRAIRDEVWHSGAPGTADARELSMGMTADLKVAIAEGATMVRVGTAVFGPRPTA